MDYLKHLSASGQPYFCWKKIHCNYINLRFLKNKTKKKIFIYLQNCPEIVSTLSRKGYQFISVFKFIYLIKSICVGFKFQ